MSLDRTYWLTPSMQGSARDVLAEAEADSTNVDDADDAAEFLRGLLADGPVGAKSVRADSDGAGYSWDQIKRASLRIGLEKRKDGLRGGWVWSLKPEGRMKVSHTIGVRPSAPSASELRPSCDPAAIESSAEIF